MNDVQKNFKKQMDKSLKRLKKENKNTYYNYLRKNHLHNPEMEEKGEGVGVSILRGLRRLLSTICILIIIVVSIALISSILNTKNKRNIAVSNSNVPSNTAVSSIAASQQTIINYLNQLNQIENSIIGDANLRTSDINSYNNKTLTAREYMESLIVYKNRIDNNINQIGSINCPKELQDYKTEVEKTYQALSLGLDGEIKYLQTKNTSELNKSNKQYNLFNENMKSKNNKLITILDQYKIKHQ